jgi:histidine triad (HIT) family protein
MSIFLKIIKGEIPCYKIAENDDFLAFLDVFPLALGHVLVIPKAPIDKFYDMPTELIGQWMQFAKPIAEAIEKAFNCKRVGMTVIGLEVPHAHMHLMPINHVDDMNFSKPKMKLTPEEFIDIQEKIKAQLEIN